MLYNIVLISLTLGLTIILLWHRIPSLIGWVSNVTSKLTSKPVPVSISLLTYFGIFLGPFLFAVLFSKASGEASQLLLLFALLLPMGLGFLWGPPPNQLLIVISYASFIFFFVAFIRTRTWGKYGVLSIAFVLLVLLNLSGCRHTGFHGPE